LFCFSGLLCSRIYNVNANFPLWWLRSSLAMPMPNSSANIQEELLFPVLLQPISFKEANALQVLLVFLKLKVKHLIYITS